MKENDREKREPKLEPIPFVGLRNRERDDEEATHPSDQQQPEPNAVGRDRVRQPRVAVASTR